MCCGRRVRSPLLWQWSGGTGSVVHFSSDEGSWWTGLFLCGSAQVSHLLSERALMSLADVSAWRCEAGVGLSWSIHARRALLNSISKVFQIHPREHLCKASNIIVATLKTAW